MDDETPQVAALQPTHQPSFTAEETDTPLPLPLPLPLPESESASITENEPPLAESILADEEKLKEIVTVVEEEIPLTPAMPPEQPLTAEHVSITATPTPPISQPLSSELAPPQESETPKPPTKEEAIEPEKSNKKAPESMVSFKEESNKLSELSDLERTALEEFRNLVQESLNNRLFSSASPSESSNSHEEVSIWGVPLLKDDRSNVILLKFLRARDFKVRESFTMLKNTIQWRRVFNVDELIKEDLGDDLEMIVFMRGQDKEGHPVCYNVYGEFQNKELYAKTFANEEKRLKFLRWRIQFLERSIRKLHFNPGGSNTIFQVSDLKNSPGPGKRELRITTKQALQILQDNYPEFVTKQVFINVPWWYLAFYTMISPFLTQRTKSKFVFAGPSKTAETLLKYISPEQLPVQYGGLSVDFCECNPMFTVDDPVTEITVKPATKQTVEIIVLEKCTIVWELRVVDWEVSYGAEYVPNEHGYTVIIQKTKKMAPTDEPVVSNSFQISKLGKILLTIDNPTAKKKKLLYRFKVVAYED